MNVLNYLQENHMLTRLKNVSADQVKNAFFSNYLAALVILRLQDVEGLHLINDPHGTHNLGMFKNTMSDVNFWARVLFQPTNPAIKPRMQFGHAEALHQMAGRITDHRVKEILLTPMQNPEKVNWQEVVATLMLLRHRFDINSTYANNLIRHFYNWDKLFSASKRKAVNDAFMYLLQSDPRSNLLPRMRSLSNSVMINVIDRVSRTFVGFKRLNEEDGGGEGGADSTGNIATGADNQVVNSIITPPKYDMMGNQFQFKNDDKVGKTSKKKSKLVIKDGKIIKKKVKGFKPRKFKLPDHLRAQKTNDDVKDTEKTTFKDMNKDHK